MPTWLIVVLVIAAILVIAVIVAYNGLVKLDERVEEAWHDITTQLQRRADLIPNLVETVKGYAKHETEAIKLVSDARAKMMGARTVEEVADADKSFMGALSRLMAISEAYPDLKANENYRDIMQELTDTEDKIQASRRFYNAGVKEFDTKLRLFPTNLINSLFLHFEAREYWTVNDEEYKKISKAPKVDMTGERKDDEEESDKPETFEKSAAPKRKK